MRNRRTFLLTVTAGIVALGVIIAPVIADELFGIITSVDVEGKKVTVLEKGTGDEVEITVTDDTEFVTPKGATKIDLGKVEKFLTKVKDAGKKGIPAKVTHEKRVASRIAVGKKKEAPKPEP
jgi:hypothetical protein